MVLKYKEFPTVSPPGQNPKKQKTKIKTVTKQGLFQISDLDPSGFDRKSLQLAHYLLLSWVDSLNAETTVSLYAVC